MLSAARIFEDTLGEDRAITLETREHAALNTPPPKTQFPLFQRTVDRLIVETLSLRNVLAAIQAAAGEDSSNTFLHVACAALESEMLIRPIRIFEDSPHASSFWSLYRADPASVGQGIDVKKLRKFSTRLKKIRDKVFVHIDKNAVFDPDAIYRQVNIAGHEIVDAVEEVWKVLNRLYSMQHGRAFHLSQATLDDLRQGFRHDLSQILKKRGCS